MVLSVSALHYTSLNQDVPFNAIGYTFTDSIHIPVHPVHPWFHFHHPPIFHPPFIILSRASAFMQTRAMKHSSKKTSDQLWQEAQTRAKRHAKKTGIPFHLWLLHSQKILPFPAPQSPDPTTDLHRAFRDELLS